MMMEGAVAGGSGDACRSLDLPGGRNLRVRPVVPDDAAGLDDLYRRLSLDDRYRRFFVAYNPPPEFFQRIASVVERGGYGLVAETDNTDGTDGRRIVGEASYFPLANGDGEFAMVVDAEWRGWLGPYLLDALVEEAAARGVPNLEADILLENRSMLAIVRARGFVALDHADFSTVRLMIGTRRRRPTWPGPHDRPRVLVEISGARWHAEEAVRTAGYDVVTCPGPGTGSTSRCPVLAGEVCPLEVGADVVVFALRPEDERAQGVLAAHARRGDALRIVLETPQAALEHFDVPAGAITLAPCRPGATVVALLDELLGRSQPTT